MVHLVSTEREAEFWELLKRWALLHVSIAIELPETDGLHTLSQMEMVFFQIQDSQWDSRPPPHSLHPQGLHIGNTVQRLHV